MKKRLTMFLATMVLCVGSVLAQTKVAGTVLSQEDGQPIIGAAVKVIGTQTGMLTDINGKFSINLPAGKNQLEISYLGYVSQTVTAKNGMRIFLKSDAQALDEVDPTKPTYRMGGNSCLSGDYVGDWSFEKPLQRGDRITFEDMNHYTTVKTNMFNGIQHPSILYKRMDGSVEVLREFDYLDYKSRMS